MNRVYIIAIALIVGIPAVAMAPTANADELVTYEVVSSDIVAAHIEYSDAFGRHALDNVVLPWRINATVSDPHSNDAALRADWQPAAAPYKSLTVRIFSRGSLLCENTLDLGDAECFGSGAYYPPVPPYRSCPAPLSSCDRGAVSNKSSNVPADR
jgi:hypothetical protein